MRNPFLVIFRSLPRGSSLNFSESSVDRRSWIVLFLLAFTGLKLVLTGAWGEGGADILQILQQAEAFVAGRDLLDPESTGTNPSFFPMGHYFLSATCLLVSGWTGITFSFLIRSSAILADLGVAFLLRTVPRGGDRAAVLYMLNPVIFLISVYHGQLHTVAMAGAVFALWLAGRCRFGLGGLMLGLAASMRQHYAPLIVPLFVTSERHRTVTLVAFASVLFLLYVPLLSSSHPERLLAPTWTYGIWGYSVPLRQGPRVLALVGLDIGFVTGSLNRMLQTYGFLLYLTWAAVFGLWALLRQKEDLWHAALFFLVGLYMVSPGFSLAWLVWVVPFWLIVNPREAMGYSTLAGALFAGSYFWQWGLNAKYEVFSITANLNLLSLGDLVGILLLGLLGFLTWAYCVRTVWRLA